MNEDIFYIDTKEEYSDDIYDLNKSCVELSYDLNAADQGFMLGFLSA